MTSACCCVLLPSVGSPRAFKTRMVPTRGEKKGKDLMVELHKNKQTRTTIKTFFFSLISSSNLTVMFCTHLWTTRSLSLIIVAHITCGLVRRSIPIFFSRSSLPFLFLEAAGGFLFRLGLLRCWSPLLRAARTTATLVATAAA